MEVSEGLLAGNALAVREKLKRGTKLCAMVKANAYGHGLTECAGVLAPVADWFGVATVEEGLSLRNAGFSHPILLTCGFSGREDTIVKRGITASLSRECEAENLGRTAERMGISCSAHIKVDTGMNRMGVKCADQAVRILETAQKFPHLAITGCYTHFFSTARNIVEDCFGAFCDLALPLKGSDPNFLLHAAASSAYLLDPRFHLDMVRIGILLYGYYPYPAQEYPVSVHPAAALSGEVLLVKDVEKGETVSYSGTHTFSQASRIAVVRLGYGDGVSRRLSNRGFVVIGNGVYPIVGNVCMDLLMAEIGGAGVSEGDRAYLFTEEYSAEHAAGHADTISYEVLAGLTARVERNYLS